MKIVVTGGAGFIGSNFVHFQVEHHPEDQIVVLDKLTYAGNLPNIQTLIDDGKIRFVKGDIADYGFVEQFFATEKLESVINFAAETHVDRSILEPDIFVKTNIVGTHNLLMASRAHGVKRFHQVSTDEVYGDLGDGSSDLFTEETPFAPNCPYAAAKAAADMLIRAYVQTYRFPATVSHCSNNYGPYQFTEKLIPYFFRAASEGTALPIYGDGKNVRDWLHVSDHCRALDMILRSDKIGEVYNIGGNSERNNLQIAELILKFLGKDPQMIRFVEDRQAHDRRYAIDASKIRRELGWEPAVKFEDGIKMTFQWYHDHQDWVKATEDRLLNFVKEKQP
jgi:dTDP-glucose 4,6-dehydratase